MRKMVLRFSAVLFTASFAVLAHAQFQQPTPEELQMTSDPKAPGAAAVYLNLEETADDNLHYKSFYARIKVLTEKGKSLANVEIPYGGVAKVRSIQARTIHPDGAIVPLDVKPETLVSVKSGNASFGKVVFTLPEVDVGSILEYRYDLQLPDEWVSSPAWNIQRDYFVHKAHYAFTPFKSFLKGSDGVTSHYVYDTVTGQVLNNLIWWASLPPGAPPLKDDALGRFYLDLTDIPARPDEEWMPPLENLLYRVQFYYKGAYDSQQYWVDEGKRWSKQVDHFADPSAGLRDAVAAIVAPTDSEEVKAGKLYDAVQALDNTDYSREKSASEKQQLKIKEAKRAEDVWKQKSGDSEDIALLYLAMLRAAGLKAYALKVVDRSRSLFDPTYLDRDQFDATLVVLETGGQKLLLDPGEKMCPFKTTSWQHSDTVGLGQSDNGPVFSKTAVQPYAQNTTARTGDVYIDEHGSVTGSVNIAMTGQVALRWRQMALQNDDAEVKKNFDRELGQIVPAGIEAHVDHFLGMNDGKLALMAVVKISGAMGAATARRLLLPGFFFESRGHEPFVAVEKRQTPVDMQFPDRVTDQVTYHLPANLTVEGAPQDASSAWPQHALYSVKVKTEPGQITVYRALLRGFDIAKFSDYQDLRGFYQKVASGDQQELVLTQTAQATGNSAPAAAAQPADGVITLVPVSR